MIIAHTIFNPCIGYKQSVAIFFLVCQFAVNQFAVFLYMSAFYEFVTWKDAVEDIKIRIAGTNLHSDGAAVGRELAGWSIEPVVGRCGGALVVKAKHHKINIDSVLFTYCFKAMRAAF